MKQAKFPNKVKMQKGAYCFGKMKITYYMDYFLMGLDRSNFSKDFFGIGGDDYEEQGAEEGRLTVVHQCMINTASHSPKPSFSFFLDTKPSDISQFSCWHV